MFLILRSLESEREGEQDMLSTFFLGHLLSRHLRLCVLFHPSYVHL